jgi:hypothetical protein
MIVHLTSAYSILRSRLPLVELHHFLGILGEHDDHIIDHRATFDVKGDYGKEASLNTRSLNYLLDLSCHSDY